MKPAGLSILRWAAESAPVLCGMNCRRILAFADTSTIVIHLIGRQDRFLVVPGSSATPFPCFIENKKELGALLGEQRPTEKFNRLPRRRLLEISGFPGDRKLAFRFGGRPDKPEDEEIAFIVHLMGEPHCLLIDAQGVILETNRALKRYPVGAVYTPPAPPKLADPLTITFPEFLRLWRSFKMEDLDQFLCRRIWGIDEELAAIFSPEPTEPLPTAASPDRRLWLVFSHLKKAIRIFLDPGVGLRTDTDSGMIIGYNDDTEGKSINGIFFERSSWGARDESRDRLAQEWRKFAATQLKRTRSAQRNLSARKSEADKAELFKEYADVLNINRHGIQKGAARVELPNPYAGNTLVSIELDPAKSLQANIEGYYKKHRRALAARDTLMKEEQRLQNAEEHLRHIAESVADDTIEESTLPIAEWRQKSIQLGLRPPPSASSDRSRDATRRRVPYRQFTLESGDIVWVGRSARDNDELTLRLAAKSDWFFHSRQTAGAHVILKHGQGAPPSATVIRQAAGVAAFFSEAKHSSLVPVVYTPIRYVKKSRKAPPGTVNLLREEIVFVEPAPPAGYHDRPESD